MEQTDLRAARLAQMKDRFWWDERRWYTPFVKERTSDGMRNIYSYYIFGVLVVQVRD